LDDLGVLGDIFWIQPEDKKVFREVLFTVKMTVESQAAELLTEARQIRDRFRSLDDRARRQMLGGEMNTRLAEITDRLRELTELAGIPGSVLRDAAAGVEEIHAEIIRECLDMDAEMV
jgi:hypothetical protein